MDAASVQTPPPPQARPVLQRSVHARGSRNYVFGGRIDEWHAPGATTTNAETRCAIDAAWLVSAVMGSPLRTPAPFPGVPRAREQVRLYAGWLKGLTEVDNVPRNVREYQIEGASFLAERDYAFLTDEMGIGKTMESLMAAEARLSLGVVPSHTTPVVLVVCPALAKRNWQREIKKWTGHEAAVLDGLRADELPEARYVIANYDILYGAQRKDQLGVMHDRADLPGWGKKLAGRFLITIFDEVHTLRGRDSKRTKAAREICQGVPVVWGLTGTPMPNHVRDLWAPVDIITGGLFGKRWAFCQAYAGMVQGQYGWDDSGSSREEELAKRLWFFMLGRTKKSVGLQLPPFQREVYKVDVEVTAPTVHEGRLAKDKSKAVADAFRLTAVAKRSAVVEQAVDALNNRQKVVVFLYMRAQCDAVAKAIHSKVDCTVFAVHGDMTPDGRDKQATTFRNVNAPACFVATIDSVGVAISLVGADLVIFGDLVAEPWKLLQAEKRCHRFDSTVSVLVRYLIAEGTIDEGAASTVIGKLEVLEKTLGADEGNQSFAELLGKKSDAEITDGLFAALSAWTGGVEE